jgi:hypothetical protein
MISASAQAPDMLSGTWRINLSKSWYSPAELAPRSGTSQIQITDDQVRVVTDGVDYQGRKTHTEYTARFDGRDYPWTGTIDGRPNPLQDTVAWRRLDSHTFETTNRLRGQMLTTTHVAIFRDGKTRVNTQVGRNGEGTTISHSIVFEKP